MPNWCRNRLVIFGFASELERVAFAELISGKNGPTTRNGESLSLESLVPYPPEMAVQADGCDLRTNWCKENWGTTWDAGNVDGPVMTDFCAFSPEGRYSLIYFFDTAWSPPRDWLEKAAKTYDLLGFGLIYAEVNWDVFGLTLWNEGKLLEDSSHDGSYLSTWLQCEALYRT